jgi:hypothetical protein
MLKRAGLTFTVPTFPARPFPTTTDDVLAARVYLARGNTDPGRTYMERVATVTSPTRTGYIGTNVFPAGVATAPPPVSSNFPATAPAKVQSSDGTTWVLQGDGNAKLGTLEVGLNGGTTLKNGIEASLGDSASASQRLWRTFKKASSGANTYELREYLYDGVTTSGKAIVLWENGAEKVRAQLQPEGLFDVRSSPPGSADYALQGVSIGRGAVPNGYDYLTADSAAANSTTIIDSGLDIVVTVSSARKYKLTCSGNVKSTVAGDRIAAILRDGTTNLQVSQSLAVAAVNSSVGFSIMKILDGPTSGTHTYKLGLQRISGSGNVVAIGGTFPTEILLEDIGAAGV